MIEYFKGAYGINLLQRAHGSAAYKAVLPGLLSLAVYFVLENNSWYNGAGDESSGRRAVSHPAAASVLLSAIAFIIIFRANHSYQRYWGACGDVHQMMSKWLDAITHAGSYHMQASHFDAVKPPSYYDHDDLNRYYLTRDRERGDDREWGVDSNADIESLATPPEASSNREARAQYKLQREESMAHVKRRKVEKSIEWVIKRTPKAKKYQRRGSSSLPKPSSCAIDQLGDQEREWATDRSASTTGAAHLLGRARLDGGWGQMYADDPARGPSSTFYDVNSGQTFFDRRDPLADGFSSVRGGRTPDLFLQELAHLGSLAVAVAFSTLRNDIEGSASPLTTYVPGEPWPEADPDKLPSERDSCVPAWLMAKNFKHWFGMDRTIEARTQFNKSRPMPVLGGVSENEIAFLQKARGASAKTQLAWSWLSEFIIREHLAGSLGNVGPPIVSRCFQFLSDGMIFYNHARKTMFIPFPFPHAQLTAIFTSVLVVVVPILMSEYTTLPWLGAVFSFLTVMCLSGLHEVARELENPFRNIPNDLPLCTLLAQFNEAVITMYSGYHPDHFWDADKIRRSWNSGTLEQSGSSMGTVVEEAPEDRADGRAPPQAAAAIDSKTSTDLLDMIQEQAKEIERLRKMVEKKQ